MSSLAISLIVFGIVFSAALVGMAVRAALPERYRDSESKEIVKLAMGMIGTLSALVLGLVVATAKSSYDEKNSQVRQMTARIILLDNLLAQYGPESAHVRKLFRQGIDGMVERVWQEDTSKDRVPFEATTIALRFFDEIERLSPQTDSQRSVQTRAIQTAGEIAQTRLLLFSQSGTSIPLPFLLTLVFWLATLFASFTLVSQSNLIAIAALFVSALSFAAAIFLILELDDAFTGLIQIPSTLVRNALPPLLELAKGL